MYQINNKGNWPELKKRLIKAYPVITEKDLELNNGNEYELIERLKIKLSKDKHEIIRLIDSV